MARVLAEVNGLNEIEATKCPRGGRCRICVDTYDQKCEFFTGCEHTDGKTTIECGHEHAGKDWHWNVSTDLRYE